MKRKILSVLLCAVMAVTLLAGCGGSAAEEPAAATEPAEEAEAEGEAEAADAAEEPAEAVSEGDINIVLSIKTITDDAFQAAVATAVENQCAERGVNYQLLTAGSQTDVATQITQIEDAIASGCSGLVISPMDGNAVVPALQKAKDAGIPVVIVDSGVAEGNEDLYITFIGTDNYAAAFEGAERLTEELGNTGNVLIVRGANGNTVGEARANGFREGLGDGITVVGEQPGDWSNDVAKQVMEDMLQANPDVTGILSCSDVMVSGIIEACQDNGLEPGEDVKIMSFDGDSIEYIKEGKVFGSMAQFPDVMGTQAVDILVDVLTGVTSPEDYESYIDSGTICYTIENADEA